MSVAGSASRVRNALWAIWPWSLLAAFFSISSSATAAVSAHVDRTFDRFSIVVRADANVSPEIAWAVLTDYNNLSRFVPDMSMSRLLSAPGEPVRVEQKGKEGLLSFVFPEEVVLAIEEQPIHRIRFRAVSGTVKSMQGEWLIIDEGNSVSVLYSAKVVAGRLVPPLLSESLLEKRLKEKMEGVVREMKRRAAQPP